MKVENGILKKFKLVAKITALALVATVMYSMIDTRPAIGSSRNAPATVEMVLRDTPLSSALQMIAENNGYKFESQAPLEEKVNLNMSGVGFEESINRLLAGRPYNWVNENNTLRVFRANPQVQPADVDLAALVPMPQPQLPQVREVEPDFNEILVLKNRRPDELVALLTPLVGGVKLMADIRTNSILMSGSQEALKAAKKIANDLDGIQTVQGMEDKREYLSEVFSLDYISDFEDLEQNLNFILYGSNQPLNNQQQTQAQSQGPGGQILEQPTVPVRKEYYLLDKIRRLLMITASRDKMEIIREYFVRVNTPLPQVLIEAQIVAIDDGFERSSGINWNFSGGYQGPIRPTDRPLGTPPQIPGVGTAVDPTEGFQFGQWNLANLLATLELAQAQNKGKILSQPKLMTLSGNEAKIHIGTRYPYKASTTLNQSGGTAENIQYVDVGILLNVTPQVNTKSGTIVMKLSPEVSDVVGFRNDAPIITSRQTSTIVEVADGETVVIGGLLRDEDLKSKSGVPILRDIPAIGEFFRFSKKSKNKTNLIILITPRVVNVKGEVLRDVVAQEAENKEEIKKIQKSSTYNKLLEKLREKVETHTN